MASCKTVTENTEPVSFNEGWKFHKGEAKNAQYLSFDDSSWRNQNLPHDWAIEGPFDIEYNARCGGLPFHGEGWYRKSFNVPKNLKGKHVSLHFDGAMYNAKIWLNGVLIGNRPNGYIGFSVKLSEYLNYGGGNLIAVQLTPEDLSSRWYPGAGIYRNTWLEINNPVHVPKWGTFITTPKITDKLANINIKTEIENTTSINKTITIQTIIFSKENQELSSISEAISVNKNEISIINQSTEIAKPKLWGLQSPYLYRAETKLFEKGNLIDTYNTTFGVRTIEYGSDFGFKLNDKSTKFQGVCLHHDLGPLGTAVNRRATERQLEIMQDMGVNAIRTSHNPPSPEQVQLCDEMGLMIQIEAFDMWEKPKVKNGYSKVFNEWHEKDLRNMIRAFRNSPSVVMWSIGNEILEQSDKINGKRIANELAMICKQEDPTRPTTAGFNYYPAPIKNGLASAIDLVGWNYKPRKYSEITERNPDWVIYGSETSSTVSSRGVYHLPIEKYELHESLQITSYDIIGPPWAYPPDIEFESLENNPNNLGEFIWTGFDYLGEPTPFGGKDNSTNGYWNGNWPARSSYFGAVDLCGLPKDRFYLYQSQWTKDPMVHVLPHWNWEGMEGKEIPVFSYTNCDEVELFVNGKSYGKKIKGIDKTPIPINFIDWEGGRYQGDFMSPYRLHWNVPYQAGEIKVVGFIDGKKVTEKQIKTAGKPARIELIADRELIKSDGEDMVFVTVRVVDKEGNLCPNSDNLINFEIEGQGAIVAVGNGNAATTEPFQSNKRKAFSGQCMVFIKAFKDAGHINLKATSEGLTLAQVQVQTKRVIN
jgi:beta-galactosidase